VTRRVAVTGARGFIGRGVTAALAARGDVPIAIARPFSTPAMTETFRTVDRVVHLAGVVSAVHERDFIAGNVDATRAVALAAAAAGVRLIHVSSLAAAGPAPPSAPRAEDDPSIPLTPYGRSKLEGEHVVAGIPGLASTILRPGAVYGQDGRTLLPLFRLAARGILPIVGRADAAFTFIHVRDVVRAILAAVDVDASGPMFVGHPRPVTPRELVEAIRSDTGGKAAMVAIPLALMRVAAAGGDLFGAVTGHAALINRWRYAEMASAGFCCRVDRLRDRLGVEAQIGLAQGIAETGDWYRSVGWL
jgi:nucleoside-diphosphate-sugar epimerase